MNKADENLNYEYSLNKVLLRWWDMSLSVNCRDMSFCLMVFYNG